MKLNIVNILAFAAFLIVLAIVIGSGWYLFGYFDGWMGSFGRYEDLDQEVSGSELFTGELEQLSIKSVAGPIEIESWDGEGINVEFVKRSTDQESLEKINVRMEQEGGKLVVWTEFPPGSSGNRGWVEYSVKIPDNIEKLQARSISGSIEIGKESENESFSGMDQRVETTSGSIFILDSGNLKVSSVSGSIIFSAGGKIEAETVSGRIDGTVFSGSGQNDINAKSVSGSVKLELTDDWSGKIDLRSISGSLKCALPVIIDIQSRTNLEGTIGTGEGSIKIKTTSGSISLN